MKIRNIYTVIAMLYIGILSAQCPSKHNTFTGATNSDWSTATNWSECCVPVSPITGFISIEANCVLSGTASYTFNTSSTFQIKAGTTFTNSSTGTWTMNGTTRGAGTYIVNTTVAGPIKPGYTTPPLVVNTGTVTYGGQTYATKLMPDGKWWMAENLNIGTMITGTTNMTNNSTLEKYCYDNVAANCATYGGLYQWNEMMQYTIISGTRGICPTGWHLPSDAEWTALETSLPSPDKASRLAGNAALWKDGRLDQSTYFGTCGFAALPAGGRITDGSFINKGNQAYFWSSSRLNLTSSWSRYLNYDNTAIYDDNDNMVYGLSIRCVQD
jgi:uncharacterized protein (TIGR02145 family)